MATPFDPVFASHGRDLHAYASRLMGDPFQGEEITQETFLRYLRNPTATALVNGSVRPWLFRVATNLAIDRLRRKRGRALAGEPTASGPTPLRPVQGEDLQAHIRAEVGRLAPELRATFLLRAHHGLSHRDVAGVLGVSERSAKDRFRRARQTLALRLSHLSGDDA